MYFFKQPSAFYLNLGPAHRDTELPPCVVALLFFIFIFIQLLCIYRTATFMLQYGLGENHTDWLLFPLQPITAVYWHTNMTLLVYGQIEKIKTLYKYRLYVLSEKHILQKHFAQYSR